MGTGSERVTAFFRKKLRREVPVPIFNSTWGWSARNEVDILEPSLYILPARN